MNIPTGTDIPRPTQPREGMLREYTKEVDGRITVHIDEYRNGEWVELASLRAGEIDDDY